MKKLIAALLALMLCLPLVACGNNENSETADGSDASSETSMPDSGETGQDADDGVRFTMLSSGNCHVLALDTDGRIWAWGHNQYGCLGDFDAVTDTPALFCDAATFTYVQASIDFSIALDSDGGLWTWGTNTCGQLGDGSTAERGKPAKVLENVTAAAAGYDFVVAIADGGKLYTWGNGSNHMLLKKDFNDTSNILTPTLVDTESEFSYVVSGHSGCIAYDTNGTRYAWGISCGVAGYYASQIGSGPEQTVVPYVLKPIADDCIGTSEFVIYSNTVYALNGGNLYLAGGKDSRLTCFESEPSFYQFTLVKEGIKAVSPSMYGTLAIDTDGNIWGWGGSSFSPCASGELKQLTSGIAFTDVVILSYLDKDVFAIDENGILYTWSAEGETPAQVSVS